MAAELHAKAETLPPQVQEAAHRQIQDLIKSGTNRPDDVNAVMTRYKSKGGSTDRIDLPVLLDINAKDNEFLRGVSEVADTFDTQPAPTPMPVMTAEVEHDTFMPTENLSFVTVKGGCF